jgi:Na+-transporting NADH:ubiquinone oxidoreductase subunit NqrA
MECLDSTHRHAEARAGTTVAVVLTEVQDKIAAGDLAIKGSVVIETVIPVHLKAQIPHVKLVRLREIEDSQDRDHSLKCDCLRHCASDFA